MKNSLFIGQALERDGAVYESNNLILSPTGSGKTYLIMEDLVVRYPGNKLMLVSTNSLKDSLGEEESTYTSQDLRRKALNITDESVYVMTYAEFGGRMKWKRDFINNYSVIFCDEIHSLFQYYFVGGESHSLGVAIETLFTQYEDKTIFYFTATTEKIDSFVDREGFDVYKEVKIFNYLKDETVKKLMNMERREFTDVSGIEDIIDSLEDFSLMGKKGIIYNDRIDGLERIERLIESKGMRSISIWSVNNPKRPMNEEQLRVRDIILKDKMMPDEYDFVNVNGAMREGYSIFDERLDVVIINSLDETSQVQIRGRARRNISILAVRVKGDVQPLDVRIMNREKSLKIIERNLGKPLTTEDKNKICEELNVRREDNGRLVKWTTIKDTLKKNGYDVQDLRKVVDGKRISVSVITKKEDKKKSSDSKASRFIAKLDELKFTEQNEKTLDNYMNKGKSVAFMHIKSSYKKKVLNGDWSERKFADITYLIARDKKLFSEKFYSEYVRHYGTKITEIDLLTERAKYEATAKDELNRKLEEDKRKREEENKELLAYIAQNSSR